jgi:cyclic beta-1,2-glucan synthetase
MVWLPQLLERSETPRTRRPEEKPEPWFASEFTARIDALREEVRRLAPWLLPEFATLRGLESPLDLPAVPLTPGTAGNFYSDLEQRLDAFASKRALPSDALETVLRLRPELPSCRIAMAELAARLQAIANECERLAREANFAPLFDKRRKLLSVGYDVGAKQLAKSCYDLLASEARTAFFVAVAKGEIPQESWFRLGRQHTMCEGQTALISWTGTMFEYLMPVLWMRSHPNTLLDRTVRSAVRAQQSYATNRGVPWGISEAAYSKTDEEGNYQYAAFGVPGLALNVARAGSLVVSPYSSCLALMADPHSALENLWRMAGKRWLTACGYYESADYTGSPLRRFLPRKCEIVRCWMAHHQGMSLVAISNLVADFPFQRWFHREPLVQASELILQERPLRTRAMADTQPRRVLSFTRRSKAPAAKAQAAAH